MGTPLADTPTRPVTRHGGMRDLHESSFSLSGKNRGRSARDLCLSPSGVAGAETRPGRGSRQLLLSISPPHHSLSRDECRVPQYRHSNIRRGGKGLPVSGHQPPQEAVADWVLSPWLLSPDVFFFPLKPLEGCAPPLHSLHPHPCSPATSERGVSLIPFPPSPQPHVCPLFCQQF